MDGSLLPGLEKDVYMRFKHSTTTCNYSNILEHRFKTQKIAIVDISNIYVSIFACTS